MYDSITSAILFFLLVPGVIVYLPPGVSILIAALVHAVVFYVVTQYISMYVPWWGVWIAAAAVIAIRWFMTRPSPTI